MMKDFYFTSEPIIGRAHELHQNLILTLQTDVIQALELTATSIDADFAIFIELAERIRDLDRLDPDFYAIYWKLTDGLRLHNISSVKYALQLMLNYLVSDVSVPNFVVRSFDINRPADKVVREFIDSPDGVRLEDGELGEMLPISEAEIQIYLDAVGRAIDTIRDADIGIADELDEYVRYFVLFKGKVITGATGVRAFGSIYLRTPPQRMTEQQKLAYFVEHLVHETSHLHLHTLMVHDPLVINDPSERYDAPIRPDPRPMFGIFHATFVLSRMMRVFNSWARSNDSVLLDELISDHLRMFEHGMLTISNHGQLTALGKRVFQTFRNTAFDGARV